MFQILPGRNFLFDDSPHSNDKSRADEKSPNVFCDFIDKGNELQHQPLLKVNQPQFTVRDCNETLTSRKAHCFGLWKFNNINSTYEIQKKGCWLNDANCKELPECYPISGTGRSGVPVIAHHVFCCCHGQRCNHGNGMLEYFLREPSLPKLTTTNTFTSTTQKPIATSSLNTQHELKTTFSSLPRNTNTIPHHHFYNTPPLHNNSLANMNFTTFIRIALSNPTSHKLLVTAITLIPICLLFIVIGAGLIIYYAACKNNNINKYNSKNYKRKSANALKNRELGSKKSSHMVANENYLQYLYDPLLYSPSGYLGLSASATKNSDWYNVWLRVVKFFHLKNVISTKHENVPTESSIYRPSKNNNSNVLNNNDDPGMYDITSSCQKYMMLNLLCQENLNHLSYPSNYIQHSTGDMDSCCLSSVLYLSFLMSLDLISPFYESYVRNQFNTQLALEKQRIITKINGGIKVEYYSPETSKKAFLLSTSAKRKRTKKLAKNLKSSLYANKNDKIIPHEIKDLLTLIVRLNLFVHDNTCNLTNAKLNSPPVIISKSSISTIYHVMPSSLETTKLERIPSSNVIKQYHERNIDCWYRELRVYALLLFDIPHSLTAQTNNSKNKNKLCSSPVTTTAEVLTNEEIKFAYHNGHPNILPLIHASCIFEEQDDTLSTVTLQYLETTIPPSPQQLIIPKPFLITPYQNCGSLYDYLSLHTVTWPELVSIVLDMCFGLAYLHNTNNLYDHLDYNKEEATQHKSADLGVNRHLSPQRNSCKDRDSCYVSHSPSPTQLYSNGDDDSNANKIGSADINDGSKIKHQRLFSCSDESTLLTSNQDVTMVTTNIFTSSSENMDTTSCPNHISNVNNNALFYRRKNSFENNFYNNRCVQKLKSHFTYKPSIVHKDIKSKNIFLHKNNENNSFERFRNHNNNNGLCAKIGDFGSSLIMEGKETLHGSSAFKCELNQKGTLRYMAPEILEGAISYNMECFLKVDVYAIALVIWELLSRCTDINNTDNLTKYALPYEKELGLNPSLEQMQQAICRNGLRPYIPQSWKDNKLSSNLVSTLNDCWEKDPEARISSVTLLERVKEIGRIHSRSPDF